jgi:hypothetical protein
MSVEDLNGDFRVIFAYVAVTVKKIDSGYNKTQYNINGLLDFGAKTCKVVIITSSIGSPPMV